MQENTNTEQNTRTSKRALDEFDEMRQALQMGRLVGEAIRAAGFHLKDKRITAITLRGDQVETIKVELEQGGRVEVLGVEEGHQNIPQLGEWVGHKIGGVAVKELLDLSEDLAAWWDNRFCGGGEESSWWSAQELLEALFARPRNIGDYRNKTAAWMGLALETLSSPQKRGAVPGLEKCQFLKSGPNRGGKRWQVLSVWDVKQG